MRYSRVHIESIGYELAPVVVSTAELEGRLAPVYQALRMPPGQLELLTGISERVDEVTVLHRHGFFTPTDARWRETFRILREWRSYMPADLAGTDFFTVEVATWHGLITYYGAST